MLATKTTKKQKRKRTDISFLYKSRTRNPKERAFNNNKKKIKEINKKNWLQLRT